MLDRVTENECAYCALVYTMFTLEFMADLHALSVCLCTIIGSLKCKTNCNVLNGIIIVIIIINSKQTAL